MEELVGRLIFNHAISDLYECCFTMKHDYETDSRNQNTKFLTSNICSNNYSPNTNFQFLSKKFFQNYAACLDTEGNNFGRTRMRSNVTMC